MHRRPRRVGANDLLVVSLRRYALGAAVCWLPFYYFFHADKPFASEQAKIKQARREKGTANEVRDPRDGPIKTLGQQKKAQENKNK